MGALFRVNGVSNDFLEMDYKTGPYLGGGQVGQPPPPDVFYLLQIQRQIYKITGHLNLDRKSRVTYVHV